MSPPKVPEGQEHLRGVARLGELLSLKRRGLKEGKILGNGCKEPNSSRDRTGGNGLP